MHSSRSFLAVVLAATVVVACSGGDDSESSDRPTGPVPAGSVPSTQLSGEAESSGDAQPVEVPDGPLAEVCPATIVVQTTGLPGVHLGPLYELIGPDAVVESGIASGAFVRPDGTIDDVTLEIRSGGPATAFRDAVDVASADDSVTVVHSSLSAMLGRHADAPTVAVAALTDRSRQSVVVDPATYPGVSDLNAVAAADIEVRHFTDSPAFVYLGASGVLSPDQLVAGFEGGPAAFVAADGTIAQQGDLLEDPTLFASIPQWDRPVSALALADAGWADHDDVLAVRAGALGDLADCLARFVPIVQQAIVAYADDPTATNELIARAVADSDPLSRVTAQVLDIGAADAITFGVIGNGGDTTIGDVDTDRLVEFLPELADALDVDDVEIDELVADDFIDPDTALNPRRRRRELRSLRALVVPGAPLVVRTPPSTPSR